MGFGSVLLAGLAGTLSILSPCVLPLVPLVLGAAVSEHRFGILALVGGLSISFTAIGLFVATIGFAIGIDAEAIRGLGALLLAGIGLVLLVPVLQLRLATAAGPIGDWTERRFGGFDSSGLGGQFAVGLLLGAVWAPCVGPTLGAASVLAAQGRDLAQVALVMLAFGLGAGLPLLILGQVSRERMLRWRSRLARTGRGGKTVMGAIFLGLALLILTGWDKRIEAVLVEISPDWLTRLTTSI